MANEKDDDVRDAIGGALGYSLSDAAFSAVDHIENAVREGDEYIPSADEVVPYTSDRMDLFLALHCAGVIETESIMDAIAEAINGVLMEAFDAGRAALEDSEDD